MRCRTPSPPPLRARASISAVSAFSGTRRPPLRQALARSAPFTLARYFVGEAEQVGSEPRVEFAHEREVAQAAPTPLSITHWYRRQRSSASTNVWDEVSHIVKLGACIAQM